MIFASNVYAIFLHEFSHDTARKCVKLFPKSPYIPELFLILSTTNYSKNYSGIMYACLYMRTENAHL